MRTALAPVEAGAAQRPLRRRTAEIYAGFCKETRSRRCDNARAVRKDDMAAFLHRIRQRKTEPSGDVIVAGACPAQRLVAGTDRMVPLRPFGGENRQRLDDPC